MSGAQVTLSTLGEQRPEWGPWLHVVEAMHREITGTEWDTAAGAVAAAPLTEPVLANASLRLDAALLRVTLRRFVAAAQSSGSEALSSGASFLHDDGLDTPALLAASVRDDRQRIAELAGTHDCQVVQPLTALFSMPFLHACRKRHESSLRDWRNAYCPICAAWPAFVEVRGIERTRHARCLRCGAAWRAQMLECAYCEARDHSQLVTLVPQDSHASGSIEACQTCGQYTKVFTVLQGCAPGAVYVEDLATADLDVAALDAGYLRPQGTAISLAVTAHVQGARRRLFGGPS